MKHTHTVAAFIVAGVFMSAPLASSALTAGDVQGQVDALLSQIKTLQAKISDLLKLQTSATATVSTNASSALSPRICALVNRNLAVGMRGDDVSGLQEYLKSNGYFAGEATGYYGSLTSQAVAKWQISQGLSAPGIFGPLSRERIKAWCGHWSPPNQMRFDVSPSSGAAPLTVTFGTWISGFRIASTYYTIDFGDGTSERAADCPAPADACVSPGLNTHTYVTEGLYTATLSKITDPCPDDGDPATPRCMAPMQTEVVAKAQIRVGDQQIACTMEYMPVCGLKSVVCIKAPCNPIQQTYGNKCMMQADGASFLHSGACRESSVSPQDDPMCKSWYDGCNTCSRATPDGPAMCTLRACIDGQTSPAYCTAYFDSSSSDKPPVISGFSGPTSLTLNETGTWKVQASDPENGELSYSITWGDEWYASPPAGISSAALSIVQTATFTHSYSSAGTYTVAITATDKAGKSAKATATVTATNNLVACTKEYMPVCGRKPGCMNTCPPGMYCAMMCQLHPALTYSNKCMMNAAGAELVHEGVCEAATY